MRWTDKSEIAKRAEHEGLAYAITYYIGRDIHTADEAFNLKWAACHDLLNEIRDELDAQEEWL